MCTVSDFRTWLSNFPTPFSEETASTVYSFLTLIQSELTMHAQVDFLEFSLLSLFHFTQYFLKVIEKKKKKKTRASKDRHWD